MGRAADDGRDDETTTTGPISDASSELRSATYGEAIVVVLHPPGANPGRRYTLSREEHFVGRRLDLDVPIDLDSVSRRHARFVQVLGEWFVEDLSSTNGTFVNDDKVEDRRRLRDGDILRFGEGVVKFLTGANIERAYHEEIYRLSILDGLTGIHNKRFFTEFVEREVARTVRHGPPLSLALFDIDHFKIVNDTHGHLAGDNVLQMLARRLKPRIRREDLLARIGGEEFACVLPETDAIGAVAFAEQLRALTESDPFTYEGAIIPITISLGVTTMDPGAELDAQELIRRADEKLYAAKNAGRNRVAA